MQAWIITIGLLAAAVPGCCAQDGQVTRAYAGNDHRVHLVTADGQERTVHAENGQDGIENVRVAGDGRTVGWLVDLRASCCVSYAIPVELVVWRSGKVIRRVKTVQAIFGWTFLKDGEEIAYHTAPLHGSEIYQCFRVDTATGRELEEWSLASKTRNPDWVKPLDAQFPIPDEEPDNAGTPAPQ